jgi:ribose transport system permease protein
MATDSLAPARQETPRRRNHEVTRNLVSRYGFAGVFAAIIIAFALIPSIQATFTSGANISNLLGNQSVLALVALASIVPLIGGQFDLSVGSVVGLTGMLTAGLTSFDHVPVALAIVAGIAAGAVIGLVNGVLVSFFKANSLIVTLAVSYIVQGIVAWYSNEQTIVTGIPTSLLSLGAGKWLGVPRTFYYLIVTAAVIYYVLRQTPFGRHLALTGANASAARLAGLPVASLTITPFVIGGLVSGAAGVLQLAVSGSASPQVGPDYTLAALAAAFLGSTTIQPGRFNVLGTMLAIFFVAVLVNGLTLLGAASFVSLLLNGAALLVAVLLSARQRR